MSVNSFLCRVKEDIEPTTELLVLPLVVPDVLGSNFDPCMTGYSLFFSVSYREVEVTLSVVAKLRTGRSGLPFPVGSRDFSRLQNVQTGSGAHAVSFSVGTEVLSSEVNRPGSVDNQAPAYTAEVMNGWSLDYPLCALLLSFLYQMPG